MLIDKEYQKEGLGTPLTILDLRKSSFWSQNEGIPGGEKKILAFPRKFSPLLAVHCIVQTPAQATVDMP